MPRMASTRGQALPRRAALAAFALGPALLLPGCGIRLEEDAPRVPLVPTRKPIGGEEALLTLLADSARLETLAGSTEGALAASLVALHGSQRTALERALTARAVPLPTASPTPTPSASGPVATLREGELAGYLGHAAYLPCAPDLRATVSSLLAQRYAAALLLGAPVRAEAPPPLSGAAVSRLVDRLREAVWRFEVIAAQSSGSQRKLAMATLAVLQQVRDEATMAGGASNPPLGYVLPGPVTTASAARALAGPTLSDLRAAFGDELIELAETTGGSGLATVPRWLGSIEAQAHRWGVPLVAFPGLG